MTNTFNTAAESETESGYYQYLNHYIELIRRERNEITKHELRAALGRSRLEQLEISLDECEKSESPVEIPDELQEHELVGFWINKLLATYRDNCGYTGNSSAELCASELNKSQLRWIIAELVDLIASELMENLKVIDVMKNRDGLLTTPGHTKDSIYYHICKQRGIHLSTKSVKERPALIREALEKWDVDNAFQESSRIMRHWAQHEHQQKKDAVSVDRMPKNKKELKEWIQYERKKRTSEESGYFIAWVEQQPQFTEFKGKKPAKSTLYAMRFMNGHLLKACNTFMNSVKRKKPTDGHTPRYMTMLNSKSLPLRQTTHSA